MRIRGGCCDRCDRYIRDHDYDYFEAYDNSLWGTYLRVYRYTIGIVCGGLEVAIERIPIHLYRRCDCGKPFTNIIVLREHEKTHDVTKGVPRVKPNL